MPQLPKTQLVPFCKQKSDDEPLAVRPTEKVASEHSKTMAGTEYLEDLRSYQQSFPENYQVGLITEKPEKLMQEQKIQKLQTS